jgi:ankyrin repeat protein
MKVPETYTSTDVSRRFLLAQFYLTSLEDKTTPREIKDALRVFQDRAERKDHDRNLDMLAEAYDEVMTRIDQQGENYRRKAHQVLSWVCYANRELEVRELQGAIAVREHEFDVDKDDLSDISLLLSVCCGIVVLSRASQTIQLVHYTAQDYFILKQERWFPDVQSYLAKQCINYLSLERFKNGLPVSADNNTIWRPFQPDRSERIQAGFDWEHRRKYTPGWYAFYEYAAVYWGYHVRRATISASNVDQAALNLLHSERKINAAIKIQIETRGPHRFPNLRRKTENLTINGLHLAAFCGLDRVIPLLMATFEANSKDSNGRTALSWAIKAGWYAVGKRLLLADADFKPVNDGGRTSLRLATEFNRAEVVQLLIDAGGNIDAVDSYGYTSLHYTARWNHVEGMQFLIKSGADINMVDKYGNTALHCAARLNNVEVVRLLINAGADINIMGKCGDTALHTAALFDHVEVMQLLIDANIVIDAVNSQGDTALHTAARSNHNTIAHLLLIHGARSHISNSKGQVPLNLAVRKGSKSVYETLCKMGANPRSCGDDRRTILMEAAWVNNEDLVKALLEEKVDFEAKDHLDRTALMEACKKGHHKIAEALLQHEASLDIQDHTGKTALMMSCEEGHQAILTMLLQHQASLDIQDHTGKTALMISCKEGHQAILETLLQRNPKLDIQDHTGQTALMKAIKERCSRVVSQLLLSGSLQKYPYLKPIYYGAALLSSANNQETFVKMLLEKGLLNSVETRDGLPPFAVLTGEHEMSAGFESIIQLLLHLGIDLTQRKEETSRKLMVEASKHGNEELVRWLIQQGISVHGADERHETPLVAASRGRHTSVVKLLRAEGARFTRHPST